MNTKIKYVIAVGNAFDGIRMIGPFNSVKQANSYIDCSAPPDAWTIAPLRGPSEVTRAIKLTALQRRWYTLALKSVAKGGVYTPSQAVREKLMRTATRTLPRNLQIQINAFNSKGN